MVHHVSIFVSGVMLIFIYFSENAEGNLEVYEEIEIEVPKEVVRNCFVMISHLHINGSINTTRICQ